MIPAERDALTTHIRSMYEAFPFPGCEYQRAQGLQLARYFAGAATGGAASLLAQGVSVMDAGCGTGSTIIPLARAYPESRFLGVDMTSASLAVAERDAKSLGLRNIEFHQADIQTLELGRRFDVVMSFGVLIVMAEPLTGLRRLAAHLAPEGRLVLWLYGSHGRHRLQLNQRMLALLTAGATSWPERLAIVRRALATLPRKHLECYFSVPSHAIEGHFEESLDWVLDHDAWIADQFMHPHELSYEMSEVLGLLDGASLRFEKWLGCDLDIAHHTGDEELRRRVSALPERERLVFFDLLLKPVDYFIAARHGAVPR